MRAVRLRTPREQAQGVIGLNPIPRDVFFIFDPVRPGSVFHMQGVSEPIDIAFLCCSGRVLELRRLEPPDGIAVAPEGTKTAVEAAPGVLQKYIWVDQLDMS